MKLLLNVSVTSLAILGLSVIALSACGEETAGDGRLNTASADCPPAQKGNGISVSSRFDYQDLLAANRWRADMFPRDCAGSLGALVPDLLPGYGVRPSHRPYIMNNEQVHLAYAALPDPLYLEEDIPNVPLDTDTIEYEIVRYSNAEIASLRGWMAENPTDYFTGDVQGTPVYLLGGFGTNRPGKPDRIATSLHILLDDNIVVRVSHKSLFSQRGGLDISPLVETIVSDIIDRSK